MMPSADSLTELCRLGRVGYTSRAAGPEEGQFFLQRKTGGRKAEAESEAEAEAEHDVEGRKRICLDQMIIYASDLSKRLGR